METLQTVSRLPSAKTDGSVTLDNGEAGPNRLPDIPGAGASPSLPSPCLADGSRPCPLGHSTALNSPPMALGWDPLLEQSRVAGGTRSLTVLTYLPSHLEQSHVVNLQSPSPSREAVAKGTVEISLCCLMMSPCTGMHGTSWITTWDMMGVGIQA